MSEPELKYDAALRAAREAVWLAVETCIADGHTHMASNCATSALDAYEALARAVGAMREVDDMPCPATHADICGRADRLRAEADWLAAPYLEVKA